MDERESNQNCEIYNCGFIAVVSVIFGIFGYEIASTHNNSYVCGCACEYVSMTVIWKAITAVAFSYNKTNRL